MTGERPVRIANCSGFYGDRLSAAREMVEGGPIDVLTGDWLAELTMLILWKAKARNADAGYATTFLTQMEQVLGTCVDRGIKVVSNAGGLNPAGCAERVRDIAGRLGLDVRVAHIEGDDLLDRVDGLRPHLDHLDTGAPLTADPVSANAYLGGWGIAAALDAGADVVVCPRVTDAALVVGPAAWWWGWGSTDWDRLAGAVVAGHVIECGPQATGGNYAFFGELPDLSRPLGFPIAEVDARRLVGDHQAPGDRRARLRGDRDRAVAVRDRSAGVRQPGRRRPLRHDPRSIRPGPTACASAALGVSRRRRWPRWRSTTTAGSATA